MSKTNQKTAVVNTILSVLKERDHEYELDGKVSMKDTLTDADRTKIRAILFVSFREGNIEYKEKFASKVADDKELKSYVSSLLNNWVRKEKSFNSGVKHEIKNKGSRAGNTDPAVKAMKALLAQTVDADAKATIQAALDTKLAEIKATKAKVEVDMSLISDELKEALGL